MERQAQQAALAARRDPGRDVEERRHRQVVVQDLDVTALFEDEQSRVSGVRHVDRRVKA